MGADRQDYYQVLGVSKDASADEIRTAYRWLSRKFHPDRNPKDERAASMMKRINAAYEVLGHPERRVQYDGVRFEEAGHLEPPPAESSQPRWTESASTSSPHPRAPARVAHAVRPVVRAVGWGIASIFTIAAVVATKKSCEMQDVGASGASGAQTERPPSLGIVESTGGPGGQQWVWSSYPDYKVTYPGNPNSPQYTTETTPWGTGHVSEIRLDRPRGAFFAVRQTDYPEDAQPSEQGVVDGSVRWMADAVHKSVRIIADQRAMMGNCFGRAFSMAAPGFTSRSLLCVRGTHSYLAVTAIASPATREDAAEEARFLESFSVISPPPAVVRNPPHPPVLASSPPRARACVDGGQCAQDASCARWNDAAGACIRLE